MANKRQTSSALKAQYVVKADGRYMNSFRDYGQARELRDQLQRQGYRNVVIEVQYY